MEKLPHETKAMFEKRKTVYEKALEAGHDSKNAIKYSNIWANITYLGCKYSPALTEISKNLGQGVDL